MNSDPSPHSPLLPSRHSNPEGFHSIHEYTHYPQSIRTTHCIVWYRIVDTQGRTVRGTTIDALDLGTNSNLIPVWKLRKLLLDENAAVLPGLISSQLSLYENVNQFQSGTPLGPSDCISPNEESDPFVLVVFCHKSRLAPIPRPAPAENTTIPIPNTRSPAAGSKESSSVAESPVRGDPTSSVPANPPSCLPLTPEVVPVTPRRDEPNDQGDRAGNAIGSTSAEFPKASARTSHPTTRVETASRFEDVQNDVLTPARSIHAIKAQQAMNGAVIHGAMLKIDFAKELPVPSRSEHNGFVNFAFLENAMVAQKTMNGTKLKGNIIHPEFAKEPSKTEQRKSMEALSPNPPPTRHLQAVHALYHVIPELSSLSQEYLRDMEVAFGINMICDLIKTQFDGRLFVVARPEYRNEVHGYLHATAKRISKKHGVNLYNLQDFKIPLRSATTKAQARGIPGGGVPTPVSDLESSIDPKQFKKVGYETFGEYLKENRVIALKFDKGDSEPVVLLVDLQHGSKISPTQDEPLVVVRESESASTGEK
ncbi:hypothetical protein HDU98_011408 [Podochytrium sp. JEL0797]|nr:hypothetical protein HDU98_011408 [Podochytrium sp. JEL0797]